MKTTIERLYEAQPALLGGHWEGADQRALLDELRENVPASALAHYLRMVAAGHKGVAVVRHGVCSQCHLRVPEATVASLPEAGLLQVCDTCGCFLLPDPAEAGATVGASPAVRRAVRVRVRAAPHS